MKLAMVPTLLSLFICSQSYAHEKENAEEIVISIKEMTFEVKGSPARGPLVLKSGQRYTFRFENDGSMMHEVLFGRKPVKSGQEFEYQEHLLAKTEVDISNPKSFEIEAFGLKELELEPNTKLSVSFELRDSHHGRWELGCFAPGHYEMGMKLPIVVEKGKAARPPASLKKHSGPSAEN